MSSERKCMCCETHEITSLISLIKFDILCCEQDFYLCEKCTKRFLEECNNLLKEINEGNTEN
jgi:hypothetical protein